MTSAAPLNFVASLPAEEVARSNFYGLLARLFYAPPDADLLSALAGAEALDAEDGGIALAWQELSQAAAQADPASVGEEFETVFVGTGKAPVTLYTCAYTVRFSNESPLVGLRAALWEMGLARREGVAEPEDHIAGLCDTMRYLIAVQKKSLEAQRAFFGRWIWPAVLPLCAAIESSPITSFYKPVARFAKCFLELEHDAFEML